MVFLGKVGAVPLGHIVMGYLHAHLIVNGRHGGGYRGIIHGRHFHLVAPGRAVFLMDSIQPVNGVRGNTGQFDKVIVIDNDNRVFVFDKLRHTVYRWRRFQKIIPLAYSGKRNFTGFHVEPPSKKP